jgi:tetratricopeptide (TPR) repeat protein
MKKETFLTLIIGILIGCIVGFIFANYANRNLMVASSPPSPNSETQPPANLRAQQSETPDIPKQKQTEIQEAEKLASDNQQSFDAQMQVAALYNDVKSYEETLEHLTLANKLRPDNTEAIIALGNAYFMTENFAEAEKWYNNALAKKPDDADVRADLGNTFFFRQPPDFERAAAEYKRALEVNPKHELALQNLTSALTRKGDAKEARAVLARLAQVNPKNSMLAKLRGELDKPNEASKP